MALSCLQHLLLLNGHPFKLWVSQSLLNFSDFILVLQLVDLTFFCCGIFLFFKQKLVLSGWSYVKWHMTTLWAISLFPQWNCYFLHFFSLLPSSTAMCVLCICSNFIDNFFITHFYICISLNVPRLKLPILNFMTQGSSLVSLGHVSNLFLNMSLPFPITKEQAQ